MSISNPESSAKQIIFVLFENKNPVSAVQEFSAESETVKEKEKFVGSRQMSKNSCGQSQFQFSSIRRFFVDWIAFEIYCLDLHQRL